MPFDLSKMKVPMKSRGPEIDQATADTIKNELGVFIKRRAKELSDNLVQAQKQVEQTQKVLTSAKKEPARPASISVAQRSSLAAEQVYQEVRMEYIVFTDSWKSAKNDKGEMIRYGLDDVIFALKKHPEVIRYTIESSESCGITEFTVRESGPPDDRLHGSNCLCIYTNDIIITDRSTKWNIGQYKVIIPLADRASTSDIHFIPKTVEGYPDYPVNFQHRHMHQRVQRTNVWTCWGSWEGIVGTVLRGRQLVSLVNIALDFLGKYNSGSPINRLEQTDVHNRMSFVKRIKA